MLFLEHKLSSGQISTGTATTYGKELRSLMRMEPNPTVADYLGALTRDGSQIPDTQALPLAPTLLFQYTPCLQLSEQVALWLATKTASRWDDVASLQRVQITVLNETELLIEWHLGGGTKSHRTQPFREDSVIVLRHLPRIPQWVISYLLTLTPEQRITKWTTRQAERFLATIPVPENQWHHGLNTKFTAHSIKRHAADVLVAAAARKVIQLSTVSIMLKHKRRNPVLMDHTIRYVANKENIARAMETDIATALL